MWICNQLRSGRGCRLVQIDVQRVKKPLQCAKGLFPHAVLAFAADSALWPFRQTCTVTI